MLLEQDSLNYDNNIIVSLLPIDLHHKVEAAFVPLVKQQSQFLF
jgi:hypothetical protein